MYKIVVCIKQVPDTTDIKWTENNTINREDVESILNPLDLYAIETALNIKDSYPDTEISVVTMGPLQAVKIIKKALSMGCDKGYLLSDKKFAGADTYATAKTLCAFVNKVIKSYDIILCGQFASDGDTAQTGPELAAQLNIPLITYVKNLKLTNKKLIIDRETEFNIEQYEAEPPLLLCITNSDIEPRRVKINGYIEAKQKDIKILNCDDINLSDNDIGLKGSPTYVSRAFIPSIKHDGVFIDKNDISNIVSKIREYINE